MNIELKAYESKINLDLLNHITAFVLDTAEATYAQRAALYRRCPFLYHHDNNFQERYGYLYLGELLERYEERFGMNPQDLRAIALALAFTSDLTTKEMFVGLQRENFLKKVRQAAGDDIFLSGALYLLDEGRDGMTEREQKLTGATYDSTEDLLFIIGLFQNAEQAFLHFKPQLLRLLGKERTMPVMGNMTALNWVIAWLAPMLKIFKGKDMALFRALCGLSTACVKPDGKTHGVLLEHGYTTLEIAYANMLVVLTGTTPGVLRTDSITSEKIAVNLFRNALICKKAFTPEVYDQLSQVFRIYKDFKIRCGGCERLLQTMEQDVHIQNAETFLWFSKQADIYHPVFQGFDIMDTKWDVLASALEPKQYRPLFEFCLRDNMSQEEIQACLDRYQELTGKNYTDFYWENSYGDRFGLLVNKGIFDLWDLFQSTLNESEHKSEMRSNIWRYVKKIQSIQAYQFFERFFAAYGAEGLEKYFGYNRRDFVEALMVKQNTYYRSEPIISLALHRDYLDDSGHRQLLSWLESYTFVYQPEKYMDLLTTILQDEFASGLFTPEEQRNLFDQTVQWSGLPRDSLNQLKRRYLTEAEQAADKEAQEAARRETERQEHETLVQSIQDYYAEHTDGSFHSAIKFLDQYHYYSEKEAISCHILREHLDELLEASGYELSPQEAFGFLNACTRLIAGNVLSFPEAQDYISKVKERTEHGTND